MGELSPWEGSAYIHGWVAVPGQLALPKFWCLVSAFSRGKLYKMYATSNEHFL